MNCTWNWITVWSFLAICIRITWQASSRDASSYVAAVVEFPPSHREGDGPATLQENTDAYVKLIKIAGEKGADIIVFPEDGITSLGLPEKTEMDSWATLIPAASEQYVPCTGNASGVSDTLKRLSCAARDYGIYVVVNIAEKHMSCMGESCSGNDAVYYNANVVLDRTGKIIARYRKVNLFMEPQFSTTSTPDIVTFETDFGVKFGTFVCFDILFHVPALNLTREHGVTDIVYTTAWFSEKPFLTAVQTQFGWAYSQNVNLLAAGYNNPGRGNTGSGVYLGRRGIGKAVFANHTLEEMVMFRVPKINRNTPEREPQTNVTDPSAEKLVYDTRGRTLQAVKPDNIVLLSDNIAVYETALFKDTISKELCHGSFCCTFKVVAKNVDPATRYRIAVFDGLRYYGMFVEAGIRVCGLIQCSNDSISSCASVHNSETIFTTIEITGKFDDYKNILVMPSTLTSSLLPFGNFDYDEHTHENHQHVSMALRNESKNIVTFGIYSRDFSRDKKISSASTAIATTYLSLVTIAIVSILF